MIILLVTLLLATNLYGASGIPAEAESVILDDFSGGLNTNVESHRVPLNMSPDMRNVYIDEKPGTITASKGYELLGSTMILQKVTGIFPYNLETGERKFIVTDSSMVLSTKDWQTYVFVSSALNPSVLLRCKQVRNEMWCTNGIDNVFTWDDTNKTELDGSGTTPDVPKGKYIEYYQNRVWLLNTSANGSALYFSALVDTNSTIIAPSNANAWPAQNLLYVGQGDGQVGTGMWVSDGLLKVGKERSIYTIFGNNEYNYEDRKIVSDVGVVSQDSVAMLDGKTYYLGQDGIYENNRRISDLIAPDVEKINKSAAQIIENRWGTYAEFITGRNVAGSTITAGGYLTILTDTLSFVNDVTLSSGPGIDFKSASTTIQNIVFTTDTVYSNGLYFAGSPDEILYDPAGYSNHAFLLKSNGGCSISEPSMSMTINNLRTGGSISLSQGVGNVPLDGTYVLKQYDFQNSTSIVFFTGDDILSGKCAVTYFVSSNSGCTDQFFTVKFPTEAGKMILTAATTGQYLSEVTTISAVTAWGKFEAISETNGGYVDYFYRTGNSASAVESAAWIPIVPGANINALSTDLYIQWATTINAVSRNNPTAVYNVTASHIEGAGSVDRAIGASWKNRFLLAVATETGGNFSLIYVKSKITNSNPDALMLFDGINIRAMVSDGETLYGGSPSTGAFYRLDYGTNYNGTPINHYYTTPDLILSYNYFDKKLYEFLLDADKETGNTLKLGVSVDGGDFEDTEISLDGTGRYVRGIKNLKRDSFNTIRFRLKNDQLDKDMNVHSMGLLYTVEKEKRTKR